MGRGAGVASTLSGVAGAALPSCVRLLGAGRGGAHRVGRGASRCSRRDRRPQLPLPRLQAAVFCSFCNSYYIPHAGNPSYPEAGGLPPNPPADGGEWRGGSPIHASGAAGRSYLMTRFAAERRTLIKCRISAAGALGTRTPASGVRGLHQGSGTAGGRLFSCRGGRRGGTCFAQRNLARAPVCRPP